MNYLGTGKTARKKRFFKSLSVSIGKDGENINVSSDKGVAQLVRKNSIMSLGIFAAAMKAKVICLMLTSVSRAESRPRDPEAGPQCSGSEQVRFDSVYLRVPKGRAPKVLEKAGRVGLDFI